MNPTLTFQELCEHLKMGKAATWDWIASNHLEKIPGSNVYRRAEVEILILCESYERQQERVKQIRSVEMGGRETLLQGVSQVTSGSRPEAVFTVAIPNATKERRKRA